MAEAELLLDRARARLAELLPERFVLIDAGSGEAPTVPDDVDARWRLKTSAGANSLLLVEAKAVLLPRDVDQVDNRLSRAARLGSEEPVRLVVAPWLSERSRALLEERGLGYLDLTGNVLLRIDNPAVFLRTQGADRAPQPVRRSSAGLHGPKARRLARLLTDIAPPLRLTDLARVGGLNRGYVSSLLQALDEQAMIERDRRGAVMDADWPALLVAAADRYQLLKNNPNSLFVAPMGATGLFSRLADEDAPDVIVTGSFAASAVAPIAAPAQLVLYADDTDSVRRFGRLLPADRGADVVLLKAEDPAQLARPRLAAGRRHIGISQLVLDCLGGNGRLPEEGQALIDWMRKNESQWRLRDIAELNG